MAEDAATRLYIPQPLAERAAVALDAAQSHRVRHVLRLGAGAGLQLYWQAARVNVDDPADCLATFRSNRVPGWLLLIGIVAGHFA